MYAAAVSIQVKLHALLELKHPAACTAVQAVKSKCSSSNHVIINSNWFELSKKRKEQKRNWHWELRSLEVVYLDFDD